MFHKHAAKQEKASAGSIYWF